MRAWPGRLPICVCVLVCRSSTGVWFWRGEREEDGVVETQGDGAGRGAETGQKKRRRGWCISAWTSHKQNWGEGCMPGEGSVCNFMFRRIEICYSCGHKSKLNKTFFYCHKTSGLLNCQNYWKVHKIGVSETPLAQWQAHGINSSSFDLMCLFQITSTTKSSLRPLHSLSLLPSSLASLQERIKSANFWWLMSSPPYKWLPYNQPPSALWLGQPLSPILWDLWDAMCSFIFPSNLLLHALGRRNWPFGLSETKTSKIRGRKKSTSLVSSLC